MFFLCLMSTRLDQPRRHVVPLEPLEYTLEVGSDSPRKCVPLQTWSPRRFPAPWAGKVDLFLVSCGLDRHSVGLMRTNSIYTVYIYICKCIHIIYIIYIYILYL